MLQASYLGVPATEQRRMHSKSRFNTLQSSSSAQPGLCTCATKLLQTSFSAVNNGITYSDLTMDIRDPGWMHTSLLSLKISFHSKKGISIQKFCTRVCISLNVLEICISPPTEICLFLDRKGQLWHGYHKNFWSFLWNRKMALTWQRARNGHYQLLSRSSGKTHLWLQYSQSQGDVIPLLWKRFFHLGKLTFLIMERHLPHRMPTVFTP